MLQLLVLSALVFVTAGAIALWLPLHGWVERVAAWLLIAHATVTGLLLVAGVVLRALEPPVITVLAVVFVVATAVLIGRRGYDVIRANLAAGLVAARDATRGRIDRLRWLPVAALAAAVLVAYAWRAVIAVRLPVLDYDGFSYHLVTVDVWLQTGEIGRVPQRYWSDGYPANGELMTLWLTIFTGIDQLATLTSFVGGPLAIAATVGVARQLGAARAPALLAGLILGAMPAVITLATTTYVDVVAVAYLAAAWFFGLAALADGGPRRRALLVLAGVAIGLGVGTKATLVLPLGVLGLGLLVDAARRVGPRALRGAVGAALVVGLPAALLGGYWYVKNILVFGNPIWPFAVGPFPGVGTFDELIVQTPPQFVGMGPLEQIVRSWLADRSIDQYSYGTRIGGYGLQWPVVLALALAGAAYLVRARRFTPLVLLAVPAAVTLAIMPMGWWARYTFFVPVVALGFAALALTRLPRVAGLAAGALVAIATAASLWVATAHGNAIFQDGRGLPTLSAMIRLVGASSEERHNLGFWRTCASLATIPPGSRVAWDQFNMLHAIAGPRSDRFALAPIVPTTDSDELLRQARDLDADFFLLHDEGISLAAARRDPEVFTVLGPGCLSTQIVAVSSEARAAP